MQQVITFDALGRPMGLVHKRRGVDLTKLGGKSKTTRYSEILYTSDNVPRMGHLDGSQCVIRILQGFAKGMFLTDHLYRLATGEEPTCDGLVLRYYRNGGSGNNVMLFDDYNRAVEFEVTFANALALKGWNKS